MRVSDEVRALILSYGDLSEAATALLLIGAATMGADLSSVRSDLVLLEQHQDVTAAVRQQIRAMLNKTFNEMLNIPPPFLEEPTVRTRSSAEPTNDLLADIGIEV